MADDNGSSGFLEGYACPECGEHRKLNIRAQTFVEVYDDETGNYEGYEWDDTSAAGCPTCGKRGTLADFRDDRVEQPPAPAPTVPAVDQMPIAELCGRLAGVTRELERWVDREAECSGDGPDMTSKCWIDLAKESLQRYRPDLLARGDDDEEDE